MKNLLLLFISCFLLLQGTEVNAQPIMKLEYKNDLMADNLKGNIKSIKEISYIFIEINGLIQKSKYDTSLTIYNRKGNIIERNLFNNGKELFSYDSNENLIESDIYWPNGSLMSKNLFKYDNKGNEIVKVRCINYRCSYLWISEYDNNSNLINWSEYSTFKRIEVYEWDPDSIGYEIIYKEDTISHDLVSKIIYKYNNKGKLIEENYYKSDTSLAYRNITYDYKYDNIGKLIEKITREGITEVKVAFKYNNYGYMIERAWYQRFYSPDTLTINFEGKWIKIDSNSAYVLKGFYKFDGTSHLIEHIEYPNEIKEIYLNDSKGNLIEVNTYNSKGTFNSKKTYKYDSTGILIEESYYNNYDNLIPHSSIKYDIDKKGNWIFEISYEKGKQSTITERYIEYY